MYNKRHLFLTATITFCVTLIVFSIVTVRFLGGYAVFDPIVKAKSIITQKYVNKLTDEQKKALDDAAIEAMVKRLGDPYTRYMGNDALNSYIEESAENYVGLGMSIALSEDGRAIVVISPYDNSPAQKAGILPGDRITYVEDTAVSAENYNDLINFIKGTGEERTKQIHLKILRGEAKEPFEMTVVPDKVEIQTVTYKTYGNIGYIRIAEFINRTEEEFTAAIETLKDLEVKGLVIDLRNNPGGYAHTVISMCDKLLPEGIIAYLEDNNGKREYFNSDSQELGLPMAILINKGTASASELLAGSVQAYGLATVIGEKSFGKAVGQTPYRVTDNTAIYLTDSRYFTPKGECIDGKGIMPDIEVTMDPLDLVRITFLKPENDGQLQKALSVLGEKIG